MIEKERIEAIKRDVDLVGLIEARGVKLKKNGKGYKGHCPFHDDQKTPSFSVTPGKNLWQCFGCGKGGDPIEFVRLFDQVEFKEAVAKLETSPAGAASTPRKPKMAVKEETGEEKPLAAAHIKLLTRVIGFYHTAFCEDPRAREYLAKRGITDNSIFSDYKIGFANGTLLNVLPAEGDIKKQLQELGILNGKGNEHFYGCVTFPLYDLDGNPAGIYGRSCAIPGARGTSSIQSVGRRIPAMDEGAAHLYLPGPRRGIFNRQAAKAHQQIILTEAVLDAVTLMNAGIKNAIPCYGVNGLTDDHVRLFKEHGPEMFHIAFDGDEAGRRGADTVAARLREEGFAVEVITLPEGQDINDFFLLTANATDAFGKLLAPASAGKEEVPAPAPPSAETPHPLEEGFGVTIEGRFYEVRAIDKAGPKLKATVKGIAHGKSGKRFHVDTVDFYSARSRAYLVRGLAELFGCEEKAINRDVERLIELAENHIPPKKPEAEPSREMAEADRQEALRFLTNPNLLEEIVADLETVGYTGEEMNKLLCYIAAISRKMDDPLSVMIQSRSAAGKSCLQDTVLSLIPEEDFIKYTRLTDQALFYKDGSLAHKILAIEELDGMSGALYSIRTIQSSKKITIAYTGKDPVTGKMKTEENTVEGPLMVFITTTQPEIDGETASRFLFISIDESREMTEKILGKQRQAHTMQGLLGKLKSAGVIGKHKNANRLLKSVKVINPYAELLTFTSSSLRARRDHTKYLGLIEAISFLFQYQRQTHTVEHDGKPIEYINVTLADIAHGNGIADEVLGRSLDELSPPSRKLLMLIKQMCGQRAEEDDREHIFSRREIREFAGWSDFQVRSHIKQLEDLEYIYSLTGRRGKEYVYELAYTGGGEDGRPFVIGLVDMDELRKKAAAAGISG